MHLTLENYNESCNSNGDLIKAAFDSVISFLWLGQLMLNSVSAYLLPNFSAYDILIALCYTICVFMWAITWESGKWRQKRCTYSIRRRTNRNIIRFDRSNMYTNEINEWYIITSTFLFALSYFRTFENKNINCIFRKCAQIIYDLFLSLPYYITVKITIFTKI